MKKKSAMGTVAKCPADAEPSLPNGIAFGEHGELLVANIGTGVLERTSPDGETRALYDEIEGQPIGKVNFITRDSRNRLWISVSTRISPIAPAVRPGLSDGYIEIGRASCRERVGQ